MNVCKKKQRKSERTLRILQQQNYITTDKRRRRRSIGRALSVNMSGQIGKKEIQEIIEIKRKRNGKLITVFAAK